MPYNVPPATNPKVPNIAVPPPRMPRLVIAKALYPSLLHVTMQLRAHLLPPGGAGVSWGGASFRVSLLVRPSLPLASRLHAELGTGLSHGWRVHEGFPVYPGLRTGMPSCRAIVLHSLGKK